MRLDPLITNGGSLALDSLVAEPLNRSTYSLAYSTFRSASAGYFPSYSDVHLHAPLL